MPPYNRAVFNRACYDILENLNSAHPALNDGKLTDRELGRIEGEMSMELTARVGGSPKDFRVRLEPDYEADFVDCTIGLIGRDVIFSMGVDIGSIGGDVVKDVEGGATILVLDTPQV